MVDKLGEHIEKGFWWLAGLVSTITMFGVGLHVKNDNDFKKHVDARFDAVGKEIDVLHKRATDHAREVAKSHPSNQDFTLLKDMIVSRLDVLQTDIREIRKNQKGA